MKKSFVAAITLLFVFLSFGSFAEAQTYLNMAADPQNLGQLPTADQELVLMYEKICDSGWGTGTPNHTVAGCYPPRSLAIRDKKSHEMIAMFPCGNEATDEHIVEGKVIPLQPNLAPAETMKAILDQIPRIIGSMDLKIQGERGERGPQGLPGRDGENANCCQTAPAQNEGGGFHFGKKSLIFTALAIVVGVAWKNDFWRHRGPGVSTDGAKVKCTATGYPNNCPTGPPGVGFSITIGGN